MRATIPEMLHWPLLRRPGYSPLRKFTGQAARSSVAPVEFGGQEAELETRHDRARVSGIYRNPPESIARSGGFFIAYEKINENIFKKSLRREKYFHILLPYRSTSQREPGAS